MSSKNNLNLTSFQVEIIVDYTNEKIILLKNKEIE